MQNFNLISKLISLLLIFILSVGISTYTTFI